MISNSTIHNRLFLTLLCIGLALSACADPWVIAHRGGGQNYPENTLLAFTKALEIGVDALELDVQVTQDGVVVVYHPDDLSQWTDGSGSISAHPWKDIATLDAGYKYKPQNNYPFRGKGLHIPTLEQVLHAYPKTVLIIDLKSLPAKALMDALVQTISDEESARLVFYSTNSEHIDLINRLKPHWRTFEKRDITRQKLLELNQSGKTTQAPTSHWIGFELKRKMSITETFTLGQGTSSLEFRLWSPRTIAALRQADSQAFLILFGINTKEDWDEAVRLGVNGVYSDNPCELCSLIQ